MAAVLHGMLAALHLECFVGFSARLRSPLPKLELRMQREPAGVLGLMPFVPCLFRLLNLTWDVGKLAEHITQANWLKVQGQLRKESLVYSLSRILAAHSLVLRASMSIKAIPKATLHSLISLLPENAVILKTCKTRKPNKLKSLLNWPLRSRCTLQRVRTVRM